jgi:uncharacterized membrane protein (DUF373 family)
MMKNISSIGHIELTWVQDIGLLIIGIWTIIAVARHLILDMKPLDTWRTLGVAAAALVLAVAVLVIRFGHTRFPYDKTDTGH